MSEEKALIFEMSKPGRRAYSLPPSDVPAAEVSEWIPEQHASGNSGGTAGSLRAQI